MATQSSTGLKANRIRHLLTFAEQLRVTALADGRPNRKRVSNKGKTTNIQTESPMNSQSVINGLTIIVTQLLRPLPASSFFDAETRVARFGWLVNGPGKEELYQIHVDCGFSKKLLHVMSQLTYCAARLQQERRALFVLCQLPICEKKSKICASGALKRTTGRPSKTARLTLSGFLSKKKGFKSHLSKT